MDHVKNTLNHIGIIETLTSIFILIVAVFTWSSGAIPVLLRLGNGLAKRKIALFAKGDHLTELRSLLIDSKIFSSKNIIEISSVQDLGRADQTSLFLVFWHDWEVDVDKILSKKNDQTALIVYAPRDLGDVPNTKRDQINEHRNSILTNFRGRLLNYLVSSMITTSYQQK